MNYKYIVIRPDTSDHHEFEVVSHLGVEARHGALREPKGLNRNLCQYAAKQAAYYGLDHFTIENKDGTTRRVNVQG